MAQGIYKKESIDNLLKSYAKLSDLKTISGITDVVNADGVSLVSNRIATLPNFVPDSTTTQLDLNSIAGVLTEYSYSDIVLDFSRMDFGATTWPEDDIVLFSTFGDAGNAPIASLVIHGDNSTIGNYEICLRDDSDNPPDPAYTTIFQEGNVLTTEATQGDLVFSASPSRLSITIASKTGVVWVSFSSKDNAIQYYSQITATLESVPEPGLMSHTVYQGLVDGLSIMYPHLWKVGAKIDFGNGLYGYRAQGTIAGVSNAQVNTKIYDTSQVLQIMSCGGYMSWGTGSSTLYGTTLGGRSDQAVSGLDMGDVVTSDTYDVYLKLLIDPPDESGEVSTVSVTYDVWFTFTEPPTPT